MSCLEGDYSIYIEVTCCDSKGDVKKGIDRLESISDDLIDRVLSAYREYYIVTSWEICLVPKRYHITRRKLKKMLTLISIVFQMFLTLH